MTTLHPTRPHTSTAHRAGRVFPGGDRNPARHPSPRRIADAVTANYIHDISQRAHRSARPRRYSRPRGAGAGDDGSGSAA
jgi:hypothetical protein